MKLALLTAVLYLSVNSLLAQNWQVLKKFDLSSKAAIKAQWDVETHPPGFVNHEEQEYIDLDSTLFVRGGKMVLKAFRQSGRFYSARIHSKDTFSVSDAVGKKLRVEFTAKVPTKAGGWPALWMLGQPDFGYGDWPREGEIDVMEWVKQIDNSIKSSLHWKSGNDFGTDFFISNEEISNTFMTYGVEYSSHIYDEYVQFYIKRSDGSVSWGPKTPKETWIWNDFPPCNYQYTAEAPKCSYLAPFDNRMILIVNFAVGGDWGGINVSPDDYNAFDSGVEMEVSSVIVYQATSH